MKRLSIVFQYMAAGLLVLCLPFSSFPLVARLTGSTMVAPLSVLPLLLLLVAWFLPYLLKRKKLPPQSLPLFGFALASILSAAAAFFIPFPPFKSANLFRSEIEAIATLAVGMCFYLVVATWAGEPGRWQFFMRLVNWGGAVMLGWSLVQAMTWRLWHAFPDWMWSFQGTVSTSLLLYANRANGFAYEPSWLAHQLNMVYLPFWLAATVSRTTAHQFRMGKFSLENGLLAAGIVVLLLSVSRIGLLAFLGMVAYLVFLWNLRLVKRLPGLVLARIKRVKPGTSYTWRVKLVQRSVLAACILAMIIIYGALLVGAAYGLSRYDERMRNIFDFSALREKSFFHYANQLVFAERIVFWQAGWEVFNDYPILGVGPGNAGYFFAQKLSAFSWALTEVRTLIYQWTSLPNIKSLWVRLLAETGLIGFAFFACWYTILWQSALYLRRRYSLGVVSTTGKSAPLHLIHTVGLAGELALVAMLFEGFSIDTYALPYYWFSFGLLTAACEFARHCSKAGCSVEQEQAQASI
jgi:O-antigen ligase